MGCRLYPMTANVANLEKLAGVPEGTHARLEEIKARHKCDEPGLTFFQREDRFGAQYEEVNADRHTAALDGFITFGWGKFNDPHNITEGEYGGSDTDPVRCAMLARPNGINYDPALCEGLCWG